MCKPMPFYGRGLGVTEFSLLRGDGANLPGAQSDPLEASEDYLEMFLPEEQ